MAPWCFGAQATETNSIQVTLSTLTIPSKSFYSKPTGPKWRPNSPGWFQPLLYLHELSYVVALMHPLKGAKPYLKPHRERGKGQLPQPHLTAGPECSPSVSILGKYIKGTALFESHIWP